MYMFVYSFYTSCCICDVFHSVFSVYVHLMYIFLSLFSVDGFYSAILLDIVLFCCCTPDNNVISPSPDMVRYSILVKVHEFLVPADFVILNTEEKDTNRRELSIILGRPFLATAGTKV